MIACVVLAALAGLFGPGPLSHSSVASDDGRLQVEYLRFVRAGGTADLDVTVQASLARDGAVTLVVDHDYLDGVDMESVTPQPSAEIARPDGIGLVFPVAPSTRALRVTFSLRPEAMGAVTGSVTVAEGPRVAFRQLSYP